MTRLVTMMAAALVVAACSSGSGTLPNETIPPMPQAAAGWASIGGVTGTGDGGSVGIELQLGGQPTALNVSCAGGGRLVVQFGDAPAAAEVFPCGGHGTAEASRLELKNMAIPATATIIVSVIPGLGDLYNSSFAVSVEQPKS